jgi:hypothetical protein
MTQSTKARRASTVHLVQKNIAILPIRACMRAVLCVWGAMTTLTAPAIAQDAPVAKIGTPTAPSFFDKWFSMVSQTQAEQPSWMTPLVTVTPRLEQEFRYDIMDQTLPNQGRLTNFGGGKGLEIIPSERTEVIVGVPPFEERNERTTSVNAFGDWPVFLAKYRFLSANEQNGNYVLSGFFQVGAPTGAAAFTDNAYVAQPTIAFGKGWGDFDLQGTLGEQFALGANDVQAGFGHPVLANLAAQYHLWSVAWPEFEVNDTYFPDGEKAGKSQVFLTPGIIFGRFPIHDRVKLIVGAGYQFAVATRNPTYKNSVVFTVRTAF